MKNKNGITLIALVITIILLLILAGVSIATLTGDNGILTQAGNAKEQTKIAEEKEIIKMAILQTINEKSDANISEAELQGELDKLTKEGKTFLVDKGENFEIYFKETNRYYEFDRIGNIKELLTIDKDKCPGDFTKNKDGQTLTGTEESPYEINCIEDLVKFSEKTNGGDAWAYINKHYKLLRDLDFKSMMSYQDYKTTSFGDINKDGNVDTLMKELTTGTGFVPIKTFSGCFNGQGFRLDNIYINKTERAAFMLHINGEGVLSNLTLGGNITSINGEAAGICNDTENNALIKNCRNEATINGSSHVGGIVSVMAVGGGQRIEDCCNIGNIISNAQVPTSDYGVGGIVGRNRGNEIVNCYNQGTIESLGENVRAGGIVGYGDNNVPKIRNSYNKGKVKGAGIAGGIYGFAYCTPIITNTYNIGKVESDINIAGAIIGGVPSFQNKSELKNCYYLDNMSKGEGSVLSESAIQYTETYMKSDKFIDELNSNIQKYKTENPEMDISGWKMWKQGEDGYPTLK